MKAVVLTKIGPANPSFQIEDRPIPTPKPDQVLIRVKAIGLNHSELATRLGESNPMGDPVLPRVLGIECVGVIESTGSDLLQGTVVMAALGGMGRMFDGSYAEYCVAPRANAIPVAASEEDLKLSWKTVGALPELLQTAHGCLFRSLQLKTGERLLVRGATSSVGLAAISLAKHAGASVVASTRKKANEALLKETGADHVLIDKDNKLQDSIEQDYPQGAVDKVLDLVGAATAADSIRCLAPGGICCSAGTLGGRWTIPNFIPNFMLPIGRYLTSYGEITFKKENAPWDELLELVQSGDLKIKLGRVYQGLECLIEAHEVMERDEAGGKVVIVL